MLAPGLDRLLVALPGASDRLLAAEAQRFEDATDMRDVIAYAKGALDQGSDAPTCPDRTTETEGFGALIEQGGQLGTLLCGQPRERAAGLLASQGTDTVGVGTCEPFADRALSDTQRVGNLLLCPALLVEFPSAQAAPFAPVAGLGRYVGSHTQAS